MFKVVFFCALGMSQAAIGSAQPAIHIEPPDLSGTHTLQQQTALAAIHNYVQAWDVFRAVMAQNRADLLDRDFIGDARDKLSATLQQQASLGIRTNYRDRAHDIQVVFYSPDGLSLELIDDVEYDIQLITADRQTSAQHVKARYLVVMTPTETKWRVRVFQAVPDSISASQ